MENTGPGPDKPEVPEPAVKYIPPRHIQLLEHSVFSQTSLPDMYFPLPLICLTNLFLKTHHQTKVFPDSPFFRADKVPLRGDSSPWSLEVSYLSGMGLVGQELSLNRHGFQGLPYTMPAQLSTQQTCQAGQLNTCMPENK